MEHFKVNGIWEDADVYQFFNLDEAKQHKTLCNNYKNILKKFKQDSQQSSWLQGNWLRR